MLPELGSVAWKRESLHAEADRLDQSAAYHREQATLAEYPTTRDEDLSCAARAAYCAATLRAVAQNLWPPERGLDLPTGIVAAYLDGQAPLQPLAPPLSRPEARTPGPDAEPDGPLYSSPKYDEGADEDDEGQEPDGWEAERGAYADARRPPRRPSYRQSVRQEDHPHA